MHIKIQQLSASYSLDSLSRTELIAFYFQHLKHVCVKEREIERH